jgi:hypothetical protein
MGIEKFLLIVLALAAASQNRYALHFRTFTFISGRFFCPSAAPVLLTLRVR